MIPADVLFVQFLLVALAIWLTGVTIRSHIRHKRRRICNCGHVHVKKCKKCDCEEFQE